MKCANGHEWHHDGKFVHAGATDHGNSQCCTGAPIAIVEEKAVKVAAKDPRWKVASAFLVTKKHIDVLVAARHPSGPGAPNLPRPAKDAWAGTIFDHMSDDALGKMLWQENVNSLDARYGKSRSTREQLGVDSGIAKGYRFNMPHEKLTIAVVMKAIHCYEYQACEHDGWESSNAKKYCEELKTMLIHHLPGYEEAPWGIPN